MPGGNLRVVLADAEPAMRAALRRAFMRAGDFALVAEAGDSETATRALQALRPDALVMGMAMPDFRTLDLIRQARLLLPALRLIVIFDEGQADDVAAFLAAGVQACLGRKAAPPEVLAALRAIAQGGVYLSRALAEASFLPRRAGRSGEAGPKLALPGERYGLTEREIEVLHYLGCGFSNKEIARRLALSVRTVETHRLNIRRKTGAGRLRDLVEAARRLGLDQQEPARQEPARQEPVRQDRPAGGDPPVSPEMPAKPSIILRRA